MIGIIKPDSYAVDLPELKRAVATQLGEPVGRVGHMIVLAEVMGEDGGWDTIACCPETTMNLPHLLYGAADAMAARASSGAC